MIETRFIESQNLSVVWPASKTNSVATVRWATRADATAIADICRNGFTAAHKNAFVEADLNQYVADAFHWRQVAAEIEVVNTLFLVAEVEGEIVGTVRLSQSLSPDSIRFPAPIELSRLYLRPQWASHGIGSTLMAHALEVATDIGSQTCWLHVWEGNTHAINFYRRWGFHPASVDSLQIGKSSPVILVMTRSLQPTGSSIRPMMREQTP